MNRASLVRDSIGWDVTNWSRCLSFWEEHSRVAAATPSVLEIGFGGTHGGLSLWLATKGFQVVCSGLQEPSPAARRLHAAYGIGDAVTYERIDVLNMPYVAAFDIVAFKSLLPGMTTGGDSWPVPQRKAIANMYRALKPGGELWFAENAAGTRIHGFFRTHFGWGRKGCGYLSATEAVGLLSAFGTVDYTTLGILGGFGRSERQRRALGAVDRALCERVTPQNWRYIITGVARRNDHGNGAEHAGDERSEKEPPEEIGAPDTACHPAS
ncbi:MULTISPECIES: bifunctional 2-polyprenyl-6-hydroxyphenol methylase/3-demethylubiquinol 3-O-methyltransferase UbiG [Protofrankia]|uniref:class I SAM-dependent methyltransferase n=1 Tax=Protofrankia TaxID=2994361 RepID=UPI000AEC455F|nr:MULTISPECIES: class I SAM-dependent methyltransferase [Protofrankia]